MAANKQIVELLIRTHGADISRFDASFLGKCLDRRVLETHCGSLEKYCAHLGENSAEAKLLLDSLHINYSVFFRNPLTFAVLESIVFPGLVYRKDRRREFRIWSAACAAGQEAYSLAILLEDLKGACREKLKYRIFATDQSKAQISEARKGRYSPDALSNMTLKRLGRYFTGHGETYTVKPELKENVDFSVFDLFCENLSCPPESIFGDFDLIFCANILFYYEKQYRELILRKIGDCLAEGGFLIVDGAERDILIDYGYHEVFPQSGIFGRKKR